MNVLLRQVLAVVLCLSVTSCATLKVTKPVAPKMPPEPVAARLGVQLSGAPLKRVFAGTGRTALGAANGQFFRELMLLPPETRYEAPQAVREQFGTDLILHVELTDTTVDNAMNPLFFAFLPLAYFMVFMPIITSRVTVSVEASLREAATSRLIWAKTIRSAATAKSAGISTGEHVKPTRVAFSNAVVDIFQQAAAAVKGYSPSKDFPEIADALQPAAASKDRYAVVIGVENYRERVPKAEFAASDAKEFAKFLIRRAGFPEENVILRTDSRASKSDFAKYLESWIKNHVDAESSLVVYYSGHGAPNTVTGEGYLVPYDGDPAYIEQTGYPLKRLYSMLDGLPAREILVVLDACFSGSGDRSLLKPGARPLITMTTETTGNNKVVVMTATSGKHISVAHQPGKHGLFTHYLLKGLNGDADANGDLSVDIRELFDYIKPQVQREARRRYNTEQVPQLHVPMPLLDSPLMKLIAKN